MTRLSALWALALTAALSATCASSASAQTVPLAPLSLAPRLGLTSIGAPTLVVDAAAKSLTPVAVLPFVSLRFDLHSLSVGASAGLQLEQQVCSGFFVREAISGGPFVVAVDGVAIGVGAREVLQGAFVLGDVVLATGPAFSQAAALDGAVDGRAFFGWSGAVVWRATEHVAVTVDASGGLDIGGHGDGAATGDVFVGARFTR